MTYAQAIQEDYANQTAKLETTYLFMPEIFIPSEHQRNCTSSPTTHIS